MPNATLSAELYWLVLTCLMTALFWVPYIVNRLIEHRPWPALWNPFPDLAPRARWAQRMMLAHANAVENLVIFAPLVLAVEWLKAGNDVTAMACMVYFWARAAHFVVFSFGIPLLRVVLFLVGFAAQMVLAVELLSLPG